MQWDCRVSAKGTLAHLGIWGHSHYGKQILRNLRSGVRSQIPFACVAVMASSSRNQLQKESRYGIRSGSECVWTRSPVYALRTPILRPFYSLIRARSEERRV